MQQTSSICDCLWYIMDPGITACPVDFGSRELKGEKGMEGGRDMRERVIIKLYRAS